MDERRAIALEQRLIVLGAVCLALAILLIVREERRIRHERLMMTKMRNSKLYAQVYPLVRFARRRDLDQVRIERNRIVFSSVCPPGKLCEFSLSEGGFRLLSGQRTRVLAEVLGEDIPILKSPVYALHRYRVMRPNGQIDYGYVYTIRSFYKSQLMRERSTAMMVNK